MKARLEIDPMTFLRNKIADLYIGKEEWKELVEKLGTNKLTVVLRFEGE